MDAVSEQIPKRRVDRPLALEPALACEGGRLDLDGEMAFAAAVVAGMAVVVGAVVDHLEPARRERRTQAFFDLAGDRAGEIRWHFSYIGGGAKEREPGLASAGKRFHGRVEGRAQACAEPGCDAPGEFRAPGLHRADFNGPGDWRWLCLDHVREFNAGYNYFEGMSSDEISEAQNPYGGWDRETRAFGTAGASPPPRWADFVDPLDAIGARFACPRARRERADGREVSEGDRRHLKTLGLDVDADRRGLRTRYAELVRRFHPDRNGGDRSHEKALQQVIEAYTALKSRPLFA